MSTTTVIMREEAALSAARLDKAAGIARGVVVCGFESLNGRSYPREVLARDHKAYEGASVFIDHSTAERKVNDWFGTLKNVRLRSDGRPVADLHYSKRSRFAPEFEERAERFPNSFGLSHVAVCRTGRKNGREVIEAITRVHSVDLVATPATNSSLFESVRRRVLHEISDSTDQLPPRDETGMAALLDQVRSLVENMENGSITVDTFEDKVNALIKSYKRVAKAMPAPPAATESGRPTWWEPEAPSAVMVEVYRERMRDEPKWFEPTLRSYRRSLWVEG